MTAFDELRDELARARAKFPGNNHLIAALVEEPTSTAQTTIARIERAAGVGCLVTCHSKARSRLPSIRLTREEEANDGK